MVAGWGLAGIYQCVKKGQMMTDTERIAARKRMVWVSYVSNSAVPHHYLASAATPPVHMTHTPILYIGWWQFCFGGFVSPLFRFCFVFVGGGGILSRVASVPCPASARAPVFCVGLIVYRPPVGKSCLFLGGLNTGSVRRAWASSGVCWPVIHK